MLLPLLLLLLNGGGDDDLVVKKKMENDNFSECAEVLINGGERRVRIVSRTLFFFIE